MTVVLDTCALLYWTHEPKRLSAAAAAALDRLSPADRGVLSSASMWEIALKHQAGRLDLGMSPAEYLSRAARLPIEIVSVDASLWLDSVALPWDHRDPVDRLVVALARRRGARVVTSDGAIRAWFRDVDW